MYDYLIIGQGLAGSILAYKLHKAGKSVCIMDDNPPVFLQNAIHKAGRAENLLLKHSDFLYPKLKMLLGNSFKPRVIGGLITPVTGKRFSKTWLADTLLPYAAAFYTKLQKEFKAVFYKGTPVVRIFADTRQANDWDVRLSEPDYSSLVLHDYTFRNENLYYPYGYTVFGSAAVVDGAKMLTSFYHFFQKQALIQKGSLQAENLKAVKNGIHAGTISAARIVFCEGWKAVYNPLFNWLPFLPAKGELLIIKAAQLKLREVVNRGIFLRPLGGDIYLSGSTYTWNDLTPQPTAQGRNEIGGKLKTLLKTDFTVIEQLAGIRPTVYDRRPLLGRHPRHENVYIFNGLGTKGLLLAPYFAQQLCDHLLQGYPLHPEVDIRRFRKNQI